MTAVGFALATTATVIAGTYGGTGANNGASTITIGGSVTVTGAFTLGLTITGNTTITLPLTGTLATLAGTETFTNKTLTAPVLTAPAIPSTDTTGYTIFNTSDQATNYERGRIYYASNTLYFGSEKGGTGTARDIRIIAGGNQYLEVKNLGSTTGGFNFVGLTTSTANAIGTRFTSWGSSATSGTNIGISWAATYNQASGTAANTDLLFNRTETALGSGTQNLFDFQVGGSSRGRLTNKGVFLPSGAVVLPAYTVATLPATAALGMVAGAVVAVTDATAPTWNATLTGGGAVHCGARYNGAAWVAC